MNPAQLLNPKAFARSASKKSRDSSQKAEAANEPPTSPRKPVSFNPLQLLNPRAAGIRKMNDPEPKDIQSLPPDNMASIGQAAPIQHGNNPASLYERHHGVEKRDATPLRRRPNHQEEDKDDDDHRRKKARFDGGARGGIIGDSVKEMRQKAQENAAPVAAIDLTEGDDEITITDIKPIVRIDDDDPRREVCIGQIDTLIMAHSFPHVNNKVLSSNNMWGPTKIFARPTPGQPNKIEIRDRRDLYFGLLDFRISEVLAPLFNAPGQAKARFSLWLPPRRKNNPDSKPGDFASEPIPCQIIIFCARVAVEEIGKRLSQRQFFLKDPINGREVKELVNPHRPKNYTPKPSAPGLPGSYGSSSGTYISRTAEQVAQDIKNIIDNLPSADGLLAQEADETLVKTPLMEHQKQAIYWIGRMESPYDPDDEARTGLWKRDYTKGWYNSISGNEVKQLPECLGGLFSDDMGLGKTLSILASIAATLFEARDFRESDLSKALQKHDTVKRNAGATLVICPTGVLSNWDEQIRSHLSSEIKYYKYHGPKRTQNIDGLAQYDIVLTSYGTAAGELTRAGSKSKALARLNWFRVVLDEAHSIKNMQTSNFKACCAVSSPRRWAVTGTPVQNRLDDLGALVKFIKLAPFHEKGSWEMHFLSTFKSGNELALSNLKALVGSVMLRRSKKKINIPDPVRKTVELEFSAAERALYDAFMQDAGIKVDTILRDNRLRGKGTAHMLTFITRLRLICCHGRELLSDEDMKVLEGRTADDAIDLGDDDDTTKPVLTDYQVYSTLEMTRASDVNKCAYCNAEVCSDEAIQAIDDEEESEVESSESHTESDNEPADVKLGYITAHYHLICTKCVSKYDRQCAQVLSPDGYCDCPVMNCGQYGRAGYVTITRAGILAEETRKQEAAVRHKQGRDVATYSGAHTKVQRLISCLQQNIADSEYLPDDQPPIRSVVFTGWTKYMNLIGFGLDDAKIPFLRLDGTMHPTKRAKVMAQFRDDPTYTVMLVSIRAGGQGLNFTAANKVYMMEPQFNPGVENQAVDRVHRIGQTREVEIVKFIMRDSFEGRIVKLQNQKMALAKEAFGEGGKGDVKDRMEGLKSLFR